MSELSAKSFLGLLSQSGIVAQDRLKAVLAELSKKAAGRPVKLDELTAHLVESGLITQWHCEKLLAGKYKGFYLGKYKLLGHLGSGGMSSVYLAQHTIFNQLRAIKVLPRRRIDDKSYLERFYREGRAAASLNHPNIVRVYDIGNEGDTHYLVMEFVDGRDLYEIVKDDGPMSYGLAVDYVIQAATGIRHAHQNGLVHRDVKPANLLVAPGGVIKILDLGLALFREEDQSLTVMHNEKVLGTADYLAPEQAINSHTVDHRADIYSLGCSLYYLLTGHPPFPEGTLAQRIAMHQHKEPAKITVDRPDCPSELVHCCEKMMCKDPDTRFQTCTEVIAALKQCRAVANAASLGPVKLAAAPARSPALAGTATRTPGRSLSGGSSAGGASSGRLAGKPASPSSQAARRTTSTSAGSTVEAETAKKQTAPAVPEKNPATAAETAQARVASRPRAAPSPRPGAKPATTARPAPVLQRTSAPALPMVDSGQAGDSQVGLRELERFASTTAPPLRRLRNKPHVRTAQWLVFAIVAAMVVFLTVLLMVIVGLSRSPEESSAVDCMRSPYMAASATTFFPAGPARYNCLAAK